MTDKEKQIEVIAKTIHYYFGLCNFEKPPTQEIALHEDDKENILKCAEEIFFYIKYKE